MLRGVTLLLKNQTAGAWQPALAPQGISLHHARMVQAAVLRTGKLPEARHGLSARTLAAIAQATRIPGLTRLARQISPRDGFARYLFQGAGDAPFEAVRIPLLHRADDPKYVACISSQVGCGMACAFCRTGTLGFTRNLEPWEMVDQVCQIQADSPHPVKGVVFMGMGEPLLNYEAVIQAACVISEPCGLAISGKAITISTAGILPGIRRLTADGHPFRLVVSITSARPAVRASLMPIEHTYPTGGLMEALRERQAATGERITLAWPLLAGINTGEEEARALGALTQGLAVKLDLIDVNDPTGRFRAPSDEERNAFRDALRRHLAAPVVRRYSGGADIQAACGMLAGSRDRYGA